MRFVDSLFNKTLKLRHIPTVTLEVDVQKLAAIIKPTSNAAIVRRCDIILVPTGFCGDVCADG